MSTTELTTAKKALKAAQAEVERLETEEARAKYRTVGGFLDLLEELVKTEHSRLPLWAEERWIGEFGSWRGVYAEAAIGFGWNGALSAIGLRNRIQTAVEERETFEGYKGGDYVFTLETPLHVDNWSEYTGDKSVTGFAVLEDRVELLVWDGDAK